eukprot:352445-Amphidinium_carterae.1
MNGSQTSVHEEDKAARDVARQKAREEERARYEKQTERKRHDAARQRQSAELRKRLRAERGMTMAGILHGRVES